MIATRKSIRNVSYAIRVFQLMSVALMGFSVYFLFRTLTAQIITTWTPWYMTLASGIVGFVGFNTACEAAKKEYELQNPQLDRIIVASLRDAREVVALILAITHNIVSWIWRHAPLHFLPKEQRRSY